MERLLRAPWLGNVRELRNWIERASVLPPGTDLTLDAAGQVAGPAGAAARKELPFKEARVMAVGSFEREYLQDLIERHRLNVSAAAREAQIDRKYLRDLLRKYDLEPQKLRERKG